jgi:hypothetical protein
LRFRQAGCVVSRQIFFDLLETGDNEGFRFNLFVIAGKVGGWENCFGEVEAGPGPPGPEWGVLP